MQTFECWLMFFEHLQSKSSPETLVHQSFCIRSDVRLSIIARQSVLNYPLFDKSAP